MEIRIGLVQSREVAFESDQDPAKVAKQIAAALADGELVNLEDVKGRRILVPPEKIAFVELGPPARARVGFGQK